MINAYDKLPPKFKAKWLDALRSGEYKQGRGALKVERFHKTTGKALKPEYCCLGVACKIVGMSDEKINDATEPSDINGDTSKIPYLLKENNNIITKLIDFNDTEKLSFKQIAKYIEKNL